mgnify:FL=1
MSLRENDIIYGELFSVKCYSMDVGQPQPLQRGPVRLGAIPLVFPQPIAGMTLVEFAHQRVAFDLGKDGRARDAQTMRVASDEAGL